MQFGLTETQQVLKNSAREFLKAECPISEVRRLMATETAFDERLWAKMAEQGWMGIVLDEQYGGMGLGLVELAAAMEEMGRALLPGPYLSTITAAAAIAAAGPHPLLSAIASGDERATLALLEDSADWSIDSVAMNVSGGRFNGRKLFVTDAAVAGHLVCAARAEGELVLGLVARDAAGVGIERTQSIDSTRPLYAVTFRDAEMTMLAEGDRARAALKHTVEVATAALTAEMVGGMQRLLDMTVEYAKTRKQFGNAIGQYQAVQHMCADMLLFAESARSAAYYAAWAVQTGSDDARAAVSVAKTYASDAYRECGNRAIQVHGGMGFTWENDAHLYYRRAKASEIEYGDAAFHRERIARLIVDTRRAKEARA
jgi:alkylation response protein AidB-like acyl-CoA dehydrogenase